MGGHGMSGGRTHGVRGGGHTVSGGADTGCPPNQRKEPEERTRPHLGREKRKRGSVRPASHFSETFQRCWDLWRDAGGRLDGSKTKTWPAWQRALAELGIDEAELERRVVEFLALTEVRAIPGLKVALAGSEKGCQFGQDNLESKRIRKAMDKPKDPREDFQFDATDWGRTAGQEEARRRRGR